MGIVQITPTIREKVLIENHIKLLPQINRAAIASTVIDQINKEYNLEWDAACEIYNGYPPDWDDRCALVKARDNYKCTKCSFPDGFKRRTRELHVHHVIAISDGGTNTLDNLVTLCHICHRNVDAKHAGVKKSPRRRK